MSFNWLLPPLSKEKITVLMGELHKRYNRTLQVTPYSHGFELTGELSNVEYPRAYAFIQGFLACKQKRDCMRFVQFQVVYRQCNYTNSYGEHEIDSTESIYALDDEGQIWRTNVQKFDYEKQEWINDGWDKIEGTAKQSLHFL